MGLAVLGGTAVVLGLSVGPVMVALSIIGGVGAALRDLAGRKKDGALREMERHVCDVVRQAKLAAIDAFDDAATAHGIQVKEVFIDAVNRKRERMSQRIAEIDTWRQATKSEHDERRKAIGERFSRNQELLADVALALNGLAKNAPGGPR
jgi:hypothetical protein